MRTLDKVALLIMPAVIVVLLPVAATFIYGIAVSPRVAEAWLRWLYEGPYWMLYAIVSVISLLPVGYAMFLVVELDSRRERTARLEALIFGVERRDTIPVSTARLIGMGFAAVVVLVWLFVG